MALANKSLLIMQQAVLIQLALVAFAVVVLAWLLAPDARRRLREMAQRAAEARFRRIRLAAHVADLNRYAEELRVAAGRAAVTAERRHREWVVAYQTREAAWNAYEAADAAARRAALASAFPAPAISTAAEDLSVNQRYLHQAATEAYQRGELTAKQLRDALAHRNGWDPRRHPYEQETMLRRAGQQRMQRAYQTASMMERSARQAADTSAAARRSLEDEAFDAATRARQADTRLAAQTPRRQRAIAAPPGAR
ncbi:MAG TPA: hypothetical protein VGP31_01675 [Planosporangium sp.]|jgi:hypothetical protein|nr:hypothetical protein [Planosporangium sp.]